jgi:hypothetical protein
MKKMRRGNVMKITNKIRKISVLLAMLALVCLSCSCSSGEKAGSSDMYDHGEAVPTVVEKDVSKMVFEGPGEMLVTEVGDWKLVPGPRYFGPDNLYDLINGGAEIYVDYGLKKMVTVEYRSAAKESLSVTVEIYDMGSVNGAFGRMARFLSGRADPSNAGKGLPSDLEGKGIMSGTDVIYFKGIYLVHFTLLDESPTATLESMSQVGKEILPIFAETIAAKITDDAPIPAEFSKFPLEDRIGRTEAFEPKDTAGIGALGPGFTVRYAQGENSWTLFGTEEFENEDLAKKKIEEISKKEHGPGEVALKKAGKRVVGLVAKTKTLSPELVDAKLEKLKSAFVAGDKS